MLAGGSGVSMFSPASTFPLAASITIQAVATGSGAGGTSIGAAAAGAAPPGCGTGTGSCAVARPTARVPSAARPIARKRRGNFIFALLRPAAGRRSCSVGLFAHGLGLVEAERHDPGRQRTDRFLRQRADPQTPDPATVGGCVVDAGTADAGAAQHLQRA